MRRQRLLPKGLRLDDLRSELCGDIRCICGDDRQSLALVIPPGKAADFQIRLFTFGGELLDGTGAMICNLVGNVIAGTTPNDYQARVVNNTPLRLGRGGKLRLAHRRDDRALSSPRMLDSEGGK